jgi:glycosyltransferase involved in cell wall biosynthesis
LEADRHLAVVSDVNQMAPALIYAINNPDTMQSLAIAGRQLVLELYDWDALADKLEQVWFECAGK